MPPPIIEVQGLKKSFHGTPILRGIDLTVEPSELTVLIGPSGCGKSTLLRCLNGLEVFEEGRISVNGLSLRREAAEMLKNHPDLVAMAQDLVQQLGKGRTRDETENCPP